MTSALRRYEICTLLLLAACGDDRRLTSPAEGPVEQLVIPPIDAGMTLRTTEEPAATAPRVAVPAVDPSAMIKARDQRPFSRAPRQRALLDVEINGLTRLTASVGQQASGPQLQRRLAEDYCELGYATQGNDAVQARKIAVSHYSAILAANPQAQNDEVLYYLALTHEQLGNLQEARTRYFELIQRHPKSKLVPSAYFAFGEMFFAEGASDASKYMLARQAYQEVLKFPANPVLEDAKRRLDSLNDGLNGP